MILLDAQGRFGIAHNTPRMAWAMKTMKAGEFRYKALDPAQFLSQKPVPITN